MLYLIGFMMHTQCFFVFRTKLFQNPGGRGSTLAPDPQNDNKINILCRRYTFICYQFMYT